MVEIEELESIVNSRLPWEMLEGKGILITGGTGLIGSGIVEALIYYNEKKALLAQQHIQIWVLSRHENIARERFSQAWEKAYFHYLEQDIKEPILLTEPIHYIVHAAGKGDPKSMMADPVGIIDANVMGTRQVLKLAKKQKSCRTVFISSGEVYGILENVDGNGIREDECGKLDTLNPRNCYGMAKRMGENLCVSYVKQYDTNVIIARLSHTYGTTALPDESRVIFQFLGRAKASEDIVMKSAGVQMRSWTYLSDAVRGIMTILFKGQSGQAYNVANAHAVCSIRELAEKIADCAGVKVFMQAPSDAEQKASSDITYAVLNSDKLESLGCEMQIDIETGIRKLLHETGDI